jgi:D-alanyl-D-alanine carboxypeptidase/D-alanyl-D-alanine-endopeptidase (penicillin-binding protein 4)
MFGLFKIKAFWLGINILLIALAGTVSNAQPVYSKPTNPQPTPTPFYQPIIIQPTAKPAASSTPLVTNISKVSSTAPDIVNPALTEMAIPGYSGILIETLDGKVVKESYSNYAFNPASNVKVATAYAVIKTFGPDYRFPTNVFTDGTIDQATGTLNGNLYVAGRDPNFTYEHAVALAQTLNKLGIRQVAGDLVVTNSFIMALNGSYQRSAELLFATLDTAKRSSTATRAWQEYLISSAKLTQITTAPSVSFTGQLYVDIIPSNAKLLFAHESAPLKEIVKITMCYSNNFLAEKLGDMLGGAYAVARVVQVNAGVTPAEFTLQTSSGLGINRVTPTAQMKLLRTFRSELAKHKLTFADVMPIAGVDPGTLQNRFKYSSSVVAKTGTLGQTDGGVSSLTGEMQTKNGKLLFVIFNQKGSAARFRNFQDSYINMVQSQQGGAGTLGYPTSALSTRMANTRIVYPTNAVAMN